MYVCNVFSLSDIYFMCYAFSADRAAFSSPSKYSGNIPKNPGILVSSGSGSPVRNSAAFRSVLNYTDDGKII